MKLRYLLLLLSFIFIGIGAKAQQNILRGQVVESGSNNRMPEVLVRNTNNNQVALSNENGIFEIRALIGHTLIFSSPGYVSDTLYLTDLRYKSVTLAQLGIALREVNVRGQRFDPRAEYPQVYQKSKVYVLSPTSWFGKEAKDARRLKRYFEHEEKERRVDSAFNKMYVGSLVPLKGRDLEVFMNLYRPSYEFVMSNAGVSMAAYVNDSYKKWLALPPEKRTVPKLSAQ